MACSPTLISVIGFGRLFLASGGVISFNGFLSASMVYDVAHEFAQRSLSYGFPVAVLFRIKINHSNDSNSYVLLKERSSNQSEYEALFSFKAIFRIESIEQIDDDLWEVDITLMDKNDHLLVKHIENESNKFNDEIIFVFEMKFLFFFLLSIFVFKYSLGAMISSVFK